MVKENKNCGVQTLVIKTCVNQVSIIVIILVTCNFKFHRRTTIKKAYGVISLYVLHPTLCNKQVLSLAYLIRDGSNRKSNRVRRDQFRWESVT